METFADIIKITKSDFDKDGHYNGPFDLGRIHNADIFIKGNLGSVHFPDLVTNFDIKIGRGTDICVHGDICARLLSSHGEVYCSAAIDVGRLRVEDKVVCEGPIQVNSMQVGGRVITPKLRLGMLEIPNPQMYYQEHMVPKKG